MSLRIGLSFWGFLGDNKIDNGGAEISAPDGNATYSWSIIWEMQRRGHIVYAMQEDRDWPAFKRWGSGNFASFAKEKRFDSYRNLKPTFGHNFPELDILLLEWRWPIDGRNCEILPDEGIYSIDRNKHQPDFIRQLELLNVYKDAKTKIIFWDLDHKLSAQQEQLWKPDAIFETSVTPLELTMKRTRVEPPFIISDLTEHPTLPQDPNRKLVYVGSRYERDDVITEWIDPAQDELPIHSVEFHGNWLNTVNECKKLWPRISYNGRVTTQDFRRIYGTAVACPLLAKKSYLESGFITPRVWEALLFGTIPIGLGTAKGIEQYVDLVATDGLDMIEVVKMLSEADLKQRDEMRRANIAKLDFMDARHFVDKIENVI